MVSLVVIYLYHRCGWLGSFGEFDPAPTSKNHYTAITQATDRIQNVVSLSCNTCFKRVNSSLQSESIIKYDYRSKMLRSPIWALVNPFSLSPRSTSKSLAHNERVWGLKPGRFSHLCTYRSQDIHLSIYLSICLSIYLSICLSVYLSICLSVYLSIYLSICLSVYLSICLSVYLSICLSVYLSICLSIYLSICLSVYLSICLSVYLSICLSVYLSFCLSIYLAI